MKRYANDLIRRMEQLTAVRAVRNGLTSMIPILTIGAFALILQTFPFQPYQDLIATLAGGFFLSLFQMVYNATFGVLSVYMTYCISRAYMKLRSGPQVVRGGAVMSSLLSFWILAGAYLPSFSIDSVGPKSMFLAILTGLGASTLYLALDRTLRRHRYVHYTTGADREFNRSVSTLAPIALVALFFALFNGLIVRLFQVDSFRTLLEQLFDGLFSLGEVGFWKGFLFVFLSSLLWFFGIHGSDTLEGVMQTYFVPGLAANQEAVAAGLVPQTVLTKGFFDCFVLMGGCGATICLLISIFLFSRNHARRQLALAAAFPMLFNINELMVFGIPIIFNPVLLVPFLTVPLACYSVAYLCTIAGWVPVITNEVAWTTPVLLGGFHATGSMAGALLQLLNIIIGVSIYFPFVRMLDQQAERRAQRDYDAFMDFFRANEQELTGMSLTERGDRYGDFAKGLCADLRQGLAEHVVLYYQPQYHYDGECMGVEALLRWRHPIHGILYPPLVVKLVEEMGLLPELEEAVLKRALSEREAVLQRFGPEVELSVNVTGTTVVTPRFLEFCRQLNAQDPFHDKNVCLEVTEQAALSFNEDTFQALGELREMGLMLAIDDFSMGQTSLHYLADNLFDILKLDGSLIRGMFTHQNNREIIASVVQLAASLNLVVLAEFVETPEQRAALHEMGCDCYQGYLYSPAVPLDKQ